MNRVIALGFLLPTLLAGCGQPETPVDESTAGYSAPQCSAHGVISGVDVSHFQGLPDWNAVHAAGRQFAFAKATESTNYQDTSFAHNWSGIAGAGMVRGAYHFLRANIDGRAQANYFVDVVNAHGGFATGDLPMLDVETSDGVSAGAVASTARAFLEQVRLRTNKTPVLYTYLSFWQNTLGNPSFSGYSLFIADYSGAQCPRMPTSWSRWAAWQYGDSDHVPGIAANVDGDLFNGTVDELRALAGGSATSCGGFSTMGAIAGKYASLGGCNGFLGAPTSNELGAPDGVGRYNYFQNGAIYFTPELGAHELHGDIFAKWTDLRREQGILGYPITDETGTPDRVGRFNHFQWGSIYWTPALGAHELHGAIGGKWAELGFEKSALGYPTSDEYSVPGGRRNDFEHGALVWDQASGAVSILMN